MSKTHNFRQCLAMSNSAKVREWWGRAYLTRFPGLRRVEVVSDLALQRQGIDVRLYLPDGSVVTCDEKVRPEGGSYDVLLEYEHEHDDGRTTPGWVCKPLTVDYLAFGWLATGDVVFVQFQPLADLWARAGSIWRRMLPPIDARNRGYVTHSVAVPLANLRDRLPDDAVYEIRI